MPIDPSPLSACQRGYLAATAGDPADPVHNTALPLLFDAPVDADRLRGAVAALIGRHAMLRTAVRPGDADRPGSQWTTAPADWWRVVEAGGLDRPALLAAAAADLRRPFDLARGLFRATLYQGARVGAQVGASAGPLLLLALHHLGGDAPSWGILGRALLAGYAAPDGPPAGSAPEVDHADYLHWEQAMLASAQGRRMADYWRAQLDGGLTPLALPTDHPRPPVKTFNGATLGLTLPDALTRAVQSLSAARACSRFAVLLAAWLVLLRDWTGQDDVWLLVPSSMPRQQPRFRAVVGLLISPLIVRVQFDRLPDQGFGALARAISGQILRGLYHQPWPVIDLLGGGWGRGGDPAVARPVPVLRAMSAWEHSDFIPRWFAAGALRAERCDIPQLDGLYDIGLTFLEDIDTGAIGAGLSYNRDLFRPPTIAHLAERYQRLLARALRDPDAPLARLSAAAG